MNPLMGASGALKTIKTTVAEILAKLAGAVDVDVSTRAPASTALSNAVWPDSLAIHLADLPLPTMDAPPIASGLVRGTGYQSVASSGAAQVFNSANFASHTTASTTFVDALNYTGSGFLTGLHHVCPADADAATLTLELVIDGVTVVSSAGANQTSSTPDTVRPIVGHAEPIYPGSTAWKLGIFPGAPLAFKSSIQVRHKSSNAAASSIAYYSLVKTG